MHLLREDYMQGNGTGKRYFKCDKLNVKIKMEISLHSAIHFFSSHSHRIILQNRLGHNNCLYNKPFPPSPVNN